MLAECRLLLAHCVLLLLEGVLPLLKRVLPLLKRVLLLLLPRCLAAAASAALSLGGLLRRRWLLLCLARRGSAMRCQRLPPWNVHCSAAVMGHTQWLPESLSECPLLGRTPVTRWCRQRSRRCVCGHSRRLPWRCWHRGVKRWCGMRC